MDKVNKEQLLREIATLYKGLLEDAGLRVTHSGSGRVVSQSIRNGTAVNGRGRTIHLTLER